MGALIEYLSSAMEPYERLPDHQTAEEKVKYLRRLQRPSAIAAVSIILQFIVIGTILFQFWIGSISRHDLVTLLSLLIAFTTLLVSDLSIRQRKLTNFLIRELGLETS